MLSGDLLGDGFSYDDNSFHIVTAMHVRRGTVLEGFEIREATYDIEPNPPEPTSGALICFGGEPLIERCTFADNRGHNMSGSVALLGSDAQFRDCLFWFNLSNWYSGAMTIVGGQPHIDACAFVNNVAYLGDGGAISAGASLLRIRRSLFLGNVSGNAGGAMWRGSSPLAEVTECEFISNLADLGGAIRFGGCFFRRCRFLNNFAASSGGAIAGGGRFVECLFEGNETSFDGGGAIHGGGHFVNCEFRNNVGTSFSGGGGAIWFNSTPAVMTNCVLNGNRSFGAGGAIFVQPGSQLSTATLVSCTIVGNIGAGASAQAIVGPCIVHNTIISANVGGSVNAVTSVSFSSVEGGWSGAGVIDLDPMFVDALGADGISGTYDDDLRLRRSSPCIDAASNRLLPLDQLDLDEDGDLAEILPLDFARNPRVMVGRVGSPPVVDMGAFEFAAHRIPVSWPAASLTPRR